MVNPALRDERRPQAEAGVMKLYDGGRAPNPRRVRIYLAEKGITVPLEPIDLGLFDHKSPAFTAINPLQRVPALVLDDGVVITESIAICRYFEVLNPQPSMFGIGAVGQALVEMWTRRVEQNLYQAVSQAFRHLHPSMKTMEVPQVAEWGEANKTKALDFLPVLDHQLGTAPFVAGEHYSVADITALVAVDFMKPARLAVPPTLRNLLRWHAEVSMRPSAKA
jgi:glutathione S-transferase